MLCRLLPEEHAVRAGHEGLQRAAGLRAVSAEALQQAMADGAAAAEAEAAAGAERAERAERGRGMQGGQERVNSSLPETLDFKGFGEARGRK